MTTGITTLYEHDPAPRESLTPLLAAAYDGGLTFPDDPETRAYCVANFVATLDGVVSYDVPGRQGGGPISGENDADHLIMGLLRARADAVLFGAGSLNGDSGHVRTPGFVYPPLIEEYAALRRQLGRSSLLPLNVAVTGSGRIDLAEPTFSTPEVRVVVATPERGAEFLRQQCLPESVEVRAFESGADGRISPSAVLALLRHEYDVRLVVNEGGPALLGSFLADDALDELFLTLSPQIAGRAAGHERLALVEGQAFSPEQAPWWTLVSVKRAGGHLFLRYRFDRAR